ncbi:TPA: hypothetical protein ACGS2I_001649 [Escherichia coli]
MCNNTRPDAAAEAIKTLMHALIDISVIADKAHKHATSETEYAGAFVPHSLALMQFSADMALNEAKAILIADCENGGAIMRNKHDIEDLAFEALHSVKKIREVVSMWMNSLSTDKSDSREEILISLLLDLANTQVSLTSDIELAAKKLPPE